MKRTIETTEFKVGNKVIITGRRGDRNQYEYSTEYEIEQYRIIKKTAHAEVHLISLVPSDLDQEDAEDDDAAKSLIKYALSGRGWHSYYEASSMNTRGSSIEITIFVFE